MRAAKAVAGGLAPAVVMIAEAVLEWAWPSTQTLLTDSVVNSAIIVVSALSVYFTPNTEA